MTALAAAARAAFTQARGRHPDESMLFSRDHRAEEEEELYALLVRLSRCALGHPAC
ncbi:hypothetical protein [Actinomadura sp. NBRC 104425]|uniref:hypothetical protein n=1 Tax=Actinomadura sp. NBRC 104425 TaxID=3032204 RepID=UPI002554DACF|nr:hypothetical protein [Actinomadura sp. NBRC 104425]